MLSYAIVDRDRERLVEELDVARQITSPPVFHARADRRRLFSGGVTGGGVIRSRLVSA
jgi:hypothetical protein